MRKDVRHPLPRVGGYGVLVPVPVAPLPEDVDRIVSVIGYLVVVIPAVCPIREIRQLGPGILLEAVAIQLGGLPAAQVPEGIKETVLAPYGPETLHFHGHLGRVRIPLIIGIDHLRVELAFNLDVRHLEEEVGLHVGLEIYLVPQHAVAGDLPAAVLLELDIQVLPVVDLETRYQRKNVDIISGPVADVCRILPQFMPVLAVRADGNAIGVRMILEGLRHVVLVAVTELHRAELHCKGREVGHAYVKGQLVEVRTSGRIRVHPPAHHRIVVGLEILVEIVRLCVHPAVAGARGIACVVGPCHAVLGFDEILGECLYVPPGRVRHLVGYLDVWFVPA